MYEVPYFDLEMKVPCETKMYWISWFWNFKKASLKSLDPGGFYQEWMTKSYYANPEHQKCSISEYFQEKEAKPILWRLLVVALKSHIYRFEMD